MSSQTITSTYDAFPLPFVAINPTGALEREVTRIISGKPTTIVLTHHGLTSGNKIDLTTRNPGWESLNTTWTVTKLDEDRLTIPLDSTHLGPFLGTALLRSQTAGVTFRYYFDRRGVEAYLTLATKPAFWRAGEWHHVALTWTADWFHMYLDGKLQAHAYSSSPFPYTGANRFSIGASAGNLMDVSLDEYSVYSVELLPEEIEHLYEQPEVPLMPKGVEGITIFGIWAPGVRKVKYSADAGPVLANRAHSWSIEVLRDNQTIATASPQTASNGFVEGLIELPDFRSGHYQLRARPFEGKTALGVAESDIYPFVQPEWLGNTFGLSQRVPAPWTPIRPSKEGRAAADFDVSGRSYNMTGGYGLPQQITSLADHLLTEPITLQLIRKATPMAVRPVTLSVTERKPGIVKWHGEADAQNAVRVSVDGSLEYDGLLVVRVSLAPVNPNAPVKLDAVRMLLSVPASVGRYLSLRKDFQPPFLPAFVAAPASGFTIDNLAPNPRGTRFQYWANINLSNDKLSLHIQHPNMAGWHINESVSWQKIHKNPDGTISYEALIANEPFELSRPLEFQVAFMATPMRPLPQHWRLATSGTYGGTRAPQSDQEMSWDFTMGNSWSHFRLLPADPALYRSHVTEPTRRSNPAFGKKLVPFVNAHVFVNAPPFATDVMAACGNETEDDGWNSSITRCTSDFWAWAMNKLVQGDVVDGYYIDESYLFRASAHLFAGGYIKANGQHGAGIDSLEARQLFRRLYFILQNSGKTDPSILVHTTGYVDPIMHSHTLVALGGENYGGYAKTDLLRGADHFDFWNQNGSLLDVTRPGRGLQYLATERFTKFGLIGQMWSGVQCCGKPFQDDRQRQAECLHQIHDLTQQDQYLDWWQIKYDFGIDAPDTRFGGYWEQTWLTAESAGIRESVYKRKRSLLAYIANFNDTDWQGDIRINATAFPSGPVGQQFVLGRNNSTYFTRPLEITQDKFEIAVPRHACAIVQLVQPDDHAGRVTQ